MAKEKKESETKEERGFTISDRRRSAREKAGETSEPESPKPPPPPPKEEAPPEEETHPTEMPPADFQYLVLFLATQALLCMGDQPDPTTGEKIKNLPGAKHAIDLLSVIQDKTKGNLTENEEQLLESLLYDLRMRYVRAAKGPSS